MDRTNRQRFFQALKAKGPDVVFIVADAQADGPPTFPDDQDGACSACGCAIYRRPWIPEGVNTLCMRCTQAAPHPVTILGHALVRRRPADEP